MYRLQQLQRYSIQVGRLHNLIRPSIVRCQYTAYHTTTYQYQQSQPAVAVKAVQSSGAINQPTGALLIDGSVHQRLQQIQQKQATTPSNTQPLLLRVSVDAGGCSGFSYSFKLDTFDSINQQNDIVYELDRSTHHSVVVDKISLDLIRGSKLCWNVDGLVRSSFAIIDNPNADTKCGCGASFSAKHV